MVLIFSMCMRIDKLFMIIGKMTHLWWFSLLLPPVWQLLVMVLPCRGFSVVFFLSLSLFLLDLCKIEFVFLVTDDFDMWRLFWDYYEIRSSDFSFLFIFIIIFTFDLSPKCNRCLLWQKYNKTFLYGSGIYILSDIYSIFILIYL